MRASLHDKNVDRNKFVAKSKCRKMKLFMVSSTPTRSRNTYDEKDVQVPFWIDRIKLDDSRRIYGGRLNDSAYCQFLRVCVN